ncbi:MAG: hypothetical protein E7H67_24310, partial [Enterobacter asburiae]|nr:hypothetical protein [Enterobacter asburiae]
SELLLCHGMVCVVGRMRDLILQLSKSSIYSTKPGTVSDQPKTVMRIRGLQFRGELRQLNGDEAERASKRYYQRFPAARMMHSPIWTIDIDEMKFTDNTLGFGKKLNWWREGASSISAN